MPRNTYLLAGLTLVLLVSAVIINTTAIEPQRAALFAGEVILFQGDPEFLEFEVSTNPSGVLECDQEIRVDLKVKVNPLGREPFDTLLDLDRSKSMDDCTIASGTTLEESSDFIGGGTWQAIDTFTISGSTPFDVLMKWSSGICTGDCPKIYIKSPTEAQYGEGHTTPNNATCSLTGVNYYTNDYVNYIAIGSASTENGTWTVYANRADPAIEYTLKIKTIVSPKSKLEAMEDESIRFLENAEWRDPQLPQYDASNADYIGYIRFGEDVFTRKNLPSARTAVIESIDNDPADSLNESVIGDSIVECIGQFDKFGRPKKEGDAEAKDFVILLSDGMNTAGTDPITAAAQAAAKDITIYTIAFGPDTDWVTLQQIAAITGGGAYQAEDEDTLRSVYALIAIDIIGKTSEGSSFYNSEVKMPIPDGMEITEIGPSGALCESGTYICFDAGDLSAVNDEWGDYYKAIIACNDDSSCQITEKIFPESGTVFYYENEFGGSYTVPWDVTVTVIFYYRDLILDILNAKIAPFSLDVNLSASNIGYLDNQTYIIRFFEYDDALGDIVLPPLDTENVTFQCAQLQPGGCSDYTEELENITMPLSIGSGSVTIYAIINSENLQHDQPAGKRDCPQGNIQIMQCFLGPESFYYVLDLYIWEK